MAGWGWRTKRGGTGRSRRKPHAGPRRAVQRQRATDEWRRAIDACVKEFVGGAHELRLPPDRTDLTGRTWIVEVPTSSEPYSTEPGTPLPTAAVAVQSSGKWRFVRYYLASRDLGVGPVRRPKPRKLVIQKESFEPAVDADHPVDAVMVRRAFVARLSRTTPLTG